RIGRTPLIHTLFPYTTLFRSLPANFVYNGFPVGFTECLFVVAHVEKAQAFFIVCQPEEIPDVFDGFRTAPITPNARGSRSQPEVDRKSTRLNSSHVKISYAVF